MHRRKRLAALLLLVLCWVAVVVLAEGTVTIGSWLIGGGGSTRSAGGGVSLGSALGQAIAGRRSSGQLDLQSGFWSGPRARATRIYAIYVPVVPEDYFPYPTLACGTSHQDYPEDTNDWYRFELNSPKTVTVQVQNYQANGDLLLYDDAGHLIAQWGQGGSTMALRDQPLAAGRFYLRVYTASGYNTAHLYTLSLTCG